MTFYLAAFCEALSLVVFEDHHVAFSDPVPLAFAAKKLAVGFVLIGRHRRQRPLVGDLDGLFPSR